MYIINFPSGVALTVATLGDVFFQMNRRRGPEEETLLGRADQMQVISASGGVYKVVQAMSHLGIEMPDSEGRVEDIILRMFREVMRYAIDEHGVPKQPWQMTVSEWGAVHSIHEVAYNVIPCLSAAHRATTCHNRAGNRCSVIEFVACEFNALLGYGGNGPVYSDDGYTNSRHDVHVAYALARGADVPLRVLADYADSENRGSDLHFLQALLVKPYLRGRIKADRLTMLLTLLRSKGSRVADITEENAPFLISIMNRLPPQATYIDADDALFLEGVLGPIERSSRPVDLGSPISPMASVIRDCILENKIKDRRKRMEEGKASGQTSLRQLAADEADLADYPNQEAYSWANKIVSAIESRALGFLIEVLDHPGNESTKKGIQKHLGIKLNGVPAAARRRAIFALCGYVDDEQYKAQEEIFQAQLKARKQAREEAERQKAEETRLQDARSLASSRNFNVNGVLMNGAQFIEKIVGEGFVAIDRKKRGAVYEHIIRNPQSGSFYKLDRKDGRLAYAQAYLEHQPMAA